MVFVVSIFQCTVASSSGNEISRPATCLATVPALRYMPATKGRGQPQIPFENFNTVTRRVSTELCDSCACLLSSI